MRKAAIFWVVSVCLSATPVLACQLASQCLDADLGPWQPIEGTHSAPGTPQGPPSETDDSLFYAFPPRIHLTEALASTGRPGVFRLDVPANALQVPKPYRSWRTSDGTLFIALGDGFTGVAAALTSMSAAWEGDLRMWSDNFGTQLYSRRLVLRPVECTSDPPIPASADLAAPRAVPSATGSALALGEPIPDGYEARSVRSQLWLVGFRPTGYWAGSDSVFVRTNRDGLISDIEVRYPTGFDAALLEAGLLSDYGPGRPDASRLVWWNRTTRARLWVDGRPSVLLVDPRMRYN